MNDTKGMFDINVLENAGGDDVLDLNINESTNPETPIDESGDVNVSVPGGMSEKAPGQPADQSIPVPAKKEITADVYNSALANIKKSFKEGVELLEMLESMTVVEKSAEDLQAEFTENALMEAYITSLEDGPMFEKVDRANKNEVKSIVRKLRPKIAREFRNEQNVDFRDYHYIIRLITNIPNMVTHIGNIADAPKNAAMLNQMLGRGAGAMAAGDAALAGVGLARDIQIIGNTIGNMIKNHTWQFLGVACTDKNGIDDFVKELNEKFKDELGDYRIIYTVTTKTIINCFMAMNKGGFKFNNRMFLLLIDDKEPDDVKNAVKQADKEIKAAHKKDKKGGSKSVNESADPEDDEDDEDEESDD